MHILIATDSFKDALSAQEACEALARGVSAALPQAHIRLRPLADGGEGTADVLARHLGLRPVRVPTCDPLGRPLPADYLLGADGRHAFIEMARTAGLPLLAPHERNALRTHTYGTGLHIAHALGQGVRRITLAIGGSATNDAGMGMATALGWRFLDAHGEPLAPAGQHLGNVAQLQPPAQTLPPLDVQVICDVTNPLYGPDGAAHTYARQKGADDDAIALLDAGLRHLASVAQRQGYPTPPQAPGMGAAGGLGYGACLFLGAQLRPGADLVMDLLGLDADLDWADLVLTGEGKMDGQTAHGKLIQRLCLRAATHQAPVMAFCGRLEASPDEVRNIGLRAALTINGPETATLPLPALLRRTAAHLEQAAFKAARADFAFL